MIDHIENGLSLLQQKNLVKLFLCYKSKFYQPKMHTGNRLNLQSCCLGKHWSPVDYRYHDSRIDADNLLCPPMHPYLVNLAQHFCPEYSGWDLCVINWYQEHNKLGLHQDNSESPEMLKLGHPVISFSVGAPAKFVVGGLKKTNPTQHYNLKSGDVFIFGGPHRLIYHGIHSINTSQINPFAKWLNNGRINFTIRKY